MAPRFARPGRVEPAAFSPRSSGGATKFGLPVDVRFCSRCVMSNQKPNSAREYSHTSATRKETLSIDAEGVCSACRNAELKNRNVDWSQREQELVDLCNRFRKADGSHD